MEDLLNAGHHVVELLFDGKVAVVDDDGVLSLHKWAVVPCTVDPVALLEVVHDIFEADGAAFTLELEETALSARLAQSHSGAVAGTTSIGTGGDPAAGAGRYYVVRDWGCASWQTAPAAEPARDLVLP